MDYLILQTTQAAEAAKRKIEANFLRYRSDWQESRGFGAALKNLNGPDINPSGKTDDFLLDSADLVMIGERAGQPNLEDGFTTQWCDVPTQRLTDSAYCIPVPPVGNLRDILLFSVPQPNSIETDPENGTWFPIGDE